MTVRPRCSSSWQPAPAAEGDGGPDRDAVDVVADPGEHREGALTGLGLTNAPRSVDSTTAGAVTARRSNAVWVATVTPATARHEPADDRGTGTRRRQLLSGR